MQLPATTTGLSRKSRHIKRIAASRRHIPAHSIVLRYAASSEYDTCRQLFKRGSKALNYGLLIDGNLVAICLGEICRWWEGANCNINEFCVSIDFQKKRIGSRFIKMI